MEVHHHSHHGKKKWTEYLWEFLMLFLAVTLGFLVENQREHYVESIREKKYISSMVDDLRSDTTNFNFALKDLRTAIRAFDTAIHLLENYKNDSATNLRLYSLVRLHLQFSNPVKLNYTAFDQMRTSGNLRLIHRRNIIDSINSYYSWARDIERLNELLEQRLKMLIEFEGKIFDGAVFHSMVDVDNFHFKSAKGNPSLINTDKLLINDFIVRAHYLVTIMLYAESDARDQKADAISLMNFLKREYHFK